MPRFSSFGRLTGSATLLLILRPFRPPAGPVPLPDAMNAPVAPDEVARVTALADRQLAILQILARLPQLPTMPEVARHLVSSLNDTDADLTPILRDVGRDMVLTAKLLRLANSPRFGLARSVASVNDAATVIGTEALRTLALSACIAGSFPKIPGFGREAFWRTSLATGGYARWLAKPAAVDPESAYLGGFMVNLGELVLALALPDYVRMVEAVPHAPGARLSWEQERFGFSHADVTAELAARWGFPLPLVDAFRFAADPFEPRRFSRLAAVIRMAMRMAEVGSHGDKGDAAVDALPGEIVDHLQLDRAWLVAHKPGWPELVAGAEAF